MTLESFIFFKKKKKIFPPIYLSLNWTNYSWVSVLQILLYLSFVIIRLFFFKFFFPKIFFYLNSNRTGNLKFYSVRFLADTRPLDNKKIEAVKIKENEWENSISEFYFPLFTISTLTTIVFKLNLILLDMQPFFFFCLLTFCHHLLMIIILSMHTLIISITKASIEWCIQALIDLVWFRYPILDQYSIHYQSRVYIGQFLDIF